MVHVDLQFLLYLVDLQEVLTDLQEVSTDIKEVPTDRQEVSTDMLEVLTDLQEAPSQLTCKQRHSALLQFQCLPLTCVSWSVVVSSLASGAQQTGVVSSSVGRELVRNGFM